MDVPNFPAFDIPKEYKNVEGLKTTLGQILPQNQQLQLRIFEAGKKMYDDLLGIGYSSEVQTRIIKENDKDAGTSMEVISHVPDNIMHCPWIGKDEQGNILHCRNEMDMLPYKINLASLPKPYCADHKMDMVWKHWNPPFTEEGFKTLCRMITSTMSESIANSTFPKDFPVVIYCVNFAEGIIETIYQNQRSWVNDTSVFLSEGFSYVLENLIVTNLQSAIYKSQDGLVRDMLKSWQVNENVTEQGSGGGGVNAHGFHPISAAKRLLGV